MLIVNSVKIVVKKLAMGSIRILFREKKNLCLIK